MQVTARGKKTFVTGWQGFTSVRDECHFARRVAAVLGTAADVNGSFLEIKGAFTPKQVEHALYEASNFTS